MPHVKFMSQMDHDFLINLFSLKLDLHGYTYVYVFNRKSYTHVHYGTCSLLIDQMKCIKDKKKIILQAQIFL